MSGIFFFIGYAENDAVVYSFRMFRIRSEQPERTDLYLTGFQENLICFNIIFSPKAQSVRYETNTEGLASLRRGYLETFAGCTAECVYLSKLTANGVKTWLQQHGIAAGTQSHFKWT